MENFIKDLMLDPRLFAACSNEVQQDIVDGIENLITRAPRRFRPCRVVDMLIGAIEGYVELSEERSEEMVRSIWSLAETCLRSAVDRGDVKKVFECVSLSSVKDLLKRPTQLLYKLMLLLVIFLSNKQMLMERLREEIKSNKANNIITVVLIVIDHFINSKENYRNADDVDRIVGICLYFIAELEWAEIKAWTKNSHKQESSLLRNMSYEPNNDSFVPLYKNDLIYFLIRSIQRSGESFAIQLLQSLFDKERVRTLGRASYKVLLAVALNKPQEIASEYSISFNPVQRKSNADVAKLLSLMDVISHWILHAEKGIVADYVQSLLDLLKEPVKFNLFAANTAIVQTAFALPLESAQSIDLQVRLWSLLNYPLRPYLWNIGYKSPKQRTVLLEELLKASLRDTEANNKFGAGNVVKCTELAYAAEDLAVRSEELGSRLTVVVGLLVVLLGKRNLLHVALPAQPVFKAKSEMEDESCQLREGGLMRIVLKLVFLIIKNDATTMGCTLLRYILFSDAEDEAGIRNFVGVKEKKGKMPVSLVSLVVRHSDAVEKCKESNRFYWESVASKKRDLKIGKTDIDPLSSKNFYYNPQSLLNYIISSLLQLIHFEVSSIKSRLQLPEEELKQVSLSTKCVQLVKIMKSVLDNPKIRTLLLKSERSFLSTAKRELSLYEVQAVPKRSGLNSSLNAFNENFDEAFSFPDINEFMKHWTKLIEEIVSLKIEFANTNLELKVLFSSEIRDIVQPTLLLLTASTFQAIDHWLAHRKIPEPKPHDKHRNEAFSHELISQIREYDAVNTMCAVPNENYANFMAQYNFNRIKKEQLTDAGCWCDKSKKQYMRSLYSYTHKQYAKLAKLCHLRKSLEAQGKLFNNSFKDFVILSSSKDRLGRSMILKRHAKIEEDPLVRHNFKYIRHFILKKMLLRLLCSTKVGREYYGSDFKYGLVKKLFRATAERAEDNTKPDTSDVLSDSRESAVSRQEPNGFEAELITIKGGIFGSLSVDRWFMSFQSLPRKHGDKYNFGATTYNQCKDKVVNKKWLLNNVTELVVKRYNLIRQAVEIYLSNSKSLLFSFFGAKNLKHFLTTFEEAARASNLRLEIVDRPELYFAGKKFTERWLKGSITNFEYLMLLNKYGGRSFNDLTQYPVFPWVIKDYTSNCLKISTKESHRDLSMPIGAMSGQSRRRADDRMSALKHSGEIPYQLGTHYSTSRTVLSFLFRLEPYTSIVLSFDNGHDSPDRMFHNVHSSWTNSITDSANNKELLPEFYYLPGLCCNYNGYMFGARCSESSSRFAKVFVDQLVLPPWASSEHCFVQMNTLALESEWTSVELNKWIDLVFGEKQRDSGCYNLYRPLCYEEYVAANEKSLTEENVAEIGDFGVVPIRLFRDKHPARTAEEFKAQAQYSIFSQLMEDRGRPFTLIDAEPFKEKQAVIFVEAYEKKIIAILNSQKAYQTKDSHINTTHDDMVFEKKAVSLYPFDEMYNEGTKMYARCDVQRCFVALDNGNDVVTCRHFDNTFKITSCANDNSTLSIDFHKGMVTSVCVSATGKKLFTGSEDGVVAMWDPKSAKKPELLWFAGDHKNAIITLDCCAKLGLLVTAEAEGILALRRIPDGGFVRTVKVGNYHKERVYEVSHVRLSHRGYVVVVKKCKSCKQRDVDYIEIFSINGNKVASKEAKDVVNSLVMSENGYEFIVGGRRGHLTKYSLTTLEETEMLMLLHEQDSRVEKALMKFKGAAITSMKLTPQKGYQQLLLGTSTGALYTFKYNSRLIGEKLFGKLKGAL